MSLQNHNVIFTEFFNSSLPSSSKPSNLLPVLELPNSPWWYSFSLKFDQFDPFFQMTQKVCQKSAIWNEKTQKFWAGWSLWPKVVATSCQNPCCSSQPWLLTFVSAPPSSQQQLSFKSWYREWNPFGAIYLSLCSPVRWRRGMSLIFFSDNARLTRECRACPCPSTSLNQWKGFVSIIHWSAIDTKKPLS